MWSADSKAGGASGSEKVKTCNETWHLRLRKARNEENITTEVIERRHHQSRDFSRTWRFHFGNQSKYPCLYRIKTGRYSHGLTPPQVAR